MRRLGEAGQLKVRRDIRADADGRVPDDSDAEDGARGVGEGPGVETHGAVPFVGFWVVGFWAGLPQTRSKLSVWTAAGGTPSRSSAAWTAPTMEGGPQRK